MSKYMVTYDLSKPGQKYEELIKSIKAYKNVKVTESLWFIVANDTAADLRTRFGAFLDSDDRLMVAGLTGGAAWRNCIASNDDLKTFLNNN